MSAMMIILLSGLTLFGAILIDPVGEEPAEPETPEADPVAPGDEANNPLDEAVAETDPPSDDEGADDSSEELEEVVDNANQTIFGSERDDTIDGEDGDDVIDGRTGNDTIEGGTGADQISGSEGDDSLFGGTIGGLDDSAEDTLIGGAGDDRLHLDDTDVATGGEGADTFVRLSTLSARALVTDFDASEDLIVIEHQSDTPPTLVDQTIASDGVILELSDDSQIELAGLTEAVDAALITFVDTRAT